MALLVGRHGGSTASGKALCTSSCVDQDVGWPSEELVNRQSEETDDGCVRRIVVHEACQETRFGLRLGGWLAVGHEDGVLVHVVCVAVMTGVAEFPRKKWDKKNAVKDPTNGRIDLEMA